MTIKKEILKNCVEDQRKRGHISSDMETELTTFIDALSDNTFLEINYSDFDQTSSVNSVFSDSLRTVTYSGAGTDELITDTITLTDNIRILGIQLKGIDANETIQITTDGTNYFTLSAYDICEIIETTDTFKIKVLVDGANTIKGINIIYQKID